MGQCAAGKYVSNNACVDCAAGTYSVAGGQTACTACPAGKTNDAGANSNACPKCVAGRYKNASNCTKCPIGKYSAEVDAQECTQCPANTFTTYDEQKSQDACEACPAGYAQSVTGGNGYAS